MKKEEDAVFLAELMVETGERAGKQMAALITDMNQRSAAWLATRSRCRSASRCCTAGDRKMCASMLELAAWMFYLGGASKTVAQGKQLAEQIIASGQAFERFRQMVELQGGDISAIDDPTRLPGTDHCVEVPSPKWICDRDRVRTGRHRLRHSRRRPRAQRRFH